MRTTISLLFYTILVFGTGCSVLPNKQNEEIRQGVYATRDAINSGRIDLADQYSEQVVRQVPPPKKRIQILPLEK